MTTTQVSVVVSTRAATARLEVPLRFRLAKGWILAVGLMFPAVLLVGGKYRRQTIIVTRMLVLLAVGPPIVAGMWSEWQRARAEYQLQEYLKVARERAKNTPVARLEFVPTSRLLP